MLKKNQVCHQFNGSLLQISQNAVFFCGKSVKNVVSCLHRLIMVTIHIFEGGTVPLTLFVVLNEITASCRISITEQPRGEAFLKMLVVRTINEQSLMVFFVIGPVCE